MILFLRHQTALPTLDPSENLLATTVISQAKPQDPWTCLSKTTGSFIPKTPRVLLSMASPPVTRRSNSMATPIPCMRRRRRALLSMVDLLRTRRSDSTDTLILEMQRRRALVDFLWPPLVSLGIPQTADYVANGMTRDVL